jgi:hypothetical protein
MNKDEALDLALEALESCTPADTSTGHVVWPSYDEQAVAQAITAIKQVRSAPVHEPFGYVYEVYCLPECAWEMEWVEGFDRYEPDAEENIRNVTPVYTTPPAAPVQEPVALDVTLDGEEAKLLRDILGDDRDELSPVRLLVGKGHSGHGLYAAHAEYQEEGAVLLAATPPAAQRQWVGLTDEERMDILLNLNWDKKLSHMDTALAIEAKLKEKNNG